MKPGCSELTRTPPVAQCSAAFLVMVRTAPLAAWYATLLPSPPTVPRIEHMLTIEPPPAEAIQRAAVLHPEPDPGLVHRDHRVPVLLGLLLDRREAADARRCSPGRRAGRVVLDRCGRRPPTRLGGDVQPARRVPTGSRELRRPAAGTPGVEVGEHQVRALRGEPFGGGRPRPPVPPVRNHDLVLEAISRRRDGSSVTQPISSYRRAASDRSATVVGGSGRTAAVGT